MVFRVSRLNITERSSGISLLIIAGNVMISLGPDDLSTEVDLQFCFAIADFYAIMAAPISRIFLPNILTMILETFVVSGST